MPGEPVKKYPLGWTAKGTFYREFLLEVPRDGVGRPVPVLREAMEGALRLDIPLTVRKVGNDWESMTPIAPRDAELGEAEA